MLTPRASVCLFVNEDNLFFLASSPNCIPSQTFLSIPAATALVWAMVFPYLYWPPGSHPWSHTHCQKDLCKLSVRSHHSQLRPSTSYLLPMAPKASLVDTPLPPYPCLLPRPRLTVCQPSWSLSCHSNSRAHSYPRAFTLAVLSIWMALPPST